MKTLLVFLSLLYVTSSISVGLASDREHQMQVEEALENLNSDPSIKKFKDIFDGSVDIKSVQLESK